MLHRVAAEFDAWATGIRRDQGPTRADTPIVRWDKKFGLVKISPLAAWTKKDVWNRILEEDVPYNPLHDQGYPSIGCWPCTRAVRRARTSGPVAGAGSTRPSAGCTPGRITTGLSRMPLQKGDSRIFVGQKIGTVPG